MSTRRARSAGTRPNTSVTAMLVATVKRSTRPFSATLPTRGMLSGCQAVNARTLPQAAASPTPAPASDSSRLSVRS